MIKRLISKIFGGGEPKPEKPVKPAVAKLKALTAKEHGIDPELVSSNAVRVTSTLQQAGFKAFIVGGAVRDLLLGVKPKDFDIATDATPEQVKRLFRRAFIIGKRFQIVHVMFGSDLLEVTTFRGASTEGAIKDEFGRVLRDNTFGEQSEDATRRDFTINAMYYDPATQTVLDYHGGIADIRKKMLRIIGQPEARYREDPVRMLRVVRFAAKLQFDIAATTRAPIPIMAPLIDNVPTARVFDEMLKLLTSGHALACLKQLRQEGLHHGLLPLLDVVLEQPLGAKFVTLSLNNTDERVRQGKTVSPGFLFAALLWHQVLEKWQAYQASGEYPIPALHLAADDVLQTQTETLALQRRIGSDMRDIWAMQPRFERRIGKTPYKLIEHPRFRAGLDFFVLRAASGEIDQEIATWWTDFFAADNAGREALLAEKPRATKKTAPVKAAAKARSKVQDQTDSDAEEILASGDDDQTTVSAPKKRRRRTKKPAVTD